MAHTDHTPNADHGHAQDPHTHGHEHPHATPCCTSACAAPALATAPSPHAAPDTGTGLLLRIPDMDCATEEAQIRRALAGMSGVQRLRFDLPARTLRIEAPEALWPALTATIERTGFVCEVQAAPATAHATQAAQRQELLRLVLALGVALAAECLDFMAPHTTMWQATGMALAAAAIALAGLGVFRKGLQALARLQLNINALMAVAVTGAFLIGQWPEAAMVMALYALAEWIEAQSVARARRAITELLALSPTTADVQQADGQWAEVDARQVALGTRVRVRPGQRLPLDGNVLEGHSAIDQAPVTGESTPVDKAPGDPVFAGTINLQGALVFEATRRAQDTVLAGIIQAVETAQGQRAPTQRFVDRFAAVYTPAVFVLAFGVAVVTPLWLGWPWLQALYKALVLLVIACPCALVISTPVTVVSGLAAAARRGILIKGGVHLEQARQIKVMALDKTGTLTAGHPTLVAQEALTDALAPDTLWALAQALAARSDHPVSRAMASGLKPPAQAPQVHDFGADVGLGVHGLVHGQRYTLGNHRWMHAQGLCSPMLEARLQAHEAQGRTVTLLADAQQVLALFAVADAVKETSRQAVAELQALGVHTLMLTGDNAATARAIGAQVGINEVQANLLPQDKLRAVQQCTAQRGPVGMVGDGINDAPALAAAALGFSMGAAGTDTAKEAADVLVMNDDLRRVPETIRLSRRTHAVLWQNIAIALGIKAVFFAWAVAGDASMWMAVFADMGASLLVVFNGLRLLRAPRP